jgi:hypothetical protein
MVSSYIVSLKTVFPECPQGSIVPHPMAVRCKLDWLIAMIAGAAVPLQPENQFKGNVEAAK